MIVEYEGMLVNWSKITYAEMIPLPGLVGNKERAFIKFHFHDNCPVVNFEFDCEIDRNTALDFIEECLIKGRKWICIDPDNLIREFSK